MASTEDRVVRMVFDNTTFERKVADTLTSLGKLNDALKFTGGTKGLSEISAAAEKVDFRTISGGIENVSKGFIALSTIAITALSRVTNMAITTGQQLVKSLTLDPVLDGFREYETNIGSIQTILANTASKGTNLDDVTAALDKLNKYSDQTIYNFGEMARNIGTFTAAGVDLQTSVDSIKGIANIAAMSGSSSAQAATAMYQLSQAIASGTLKLMDWNSVVNAGMGGEAFQNALFETGKAMKTLKDVPMGQTFQEWKDAGNSFRESLQDGWITADVLTTTLSAFTGDMTEEMLLAKGFNEQQAEAILKTADIAKRAATEVKTFSQLMSTVKEAIGTGWADSFRILIGNFTEAKELWTGLNNSIGSFISKTSDARNALLQSWKDMGGRTLLIESLRTAFQNLMQILAPIGEAFRDVFPAVTAQNLYNITAAFSRFATALQPTQQTIERIHSIFQGLFSALAIGWEVLKEGAKFFIDLGRDIAQALGGKVVDSIAGISDGISSLKQTLVDGGAIHRFFEKLGEVIRAPLPFIKAVMQTIGDIFSLFKPGDGEKVIDVTGRIGDRFQTLLSIFDGASGIFGKFFDALTSVVEKVQPVLEKIFTAIRDWFKELGNRLGKALSAGDFEGLFDALNTALLGGIALLISNFLKKGFTFSSSIDIGSGMFAKIGQAFQQLTGVLKAMQTNIKANALLKIAGAIAVLTASVLVLSLIDSEALSKALAAMAVGFGQLIASFTLLTKLVSDPKEAASFSIAAGGMVILAGAMLLLSFAVRSLAKLKWEELAKGLTGIVGLLGALSLASKPLSANASGMITAGIGITAIAGALLILSIPMKVFSRMKWEEIGKGLTGIAGGLAILIGAMHLMPSGLAMVAQGAGLIGVAVALNILSGAVAIFGTMEWETIGKGMAGIAASLFIIAGALNLMPVSTPIIAAGLILVGIALSEIAIATKLFAKMDWEEIARGLTGMAGSLAILAGALFLMGQTGLGAAALVVAAVGLGILGAVVKQFAKLSWDELLHGLGAVAITLGVIAGASLLLQPAIPVMLAMGAALFVLGAGFALVGGGIYALAKGLNMIGNLGKNTITALTDILKTFAKALPQIMRSAAEGVVEALDVFVQAAPAMVKSLSVLVGMLLDTIIENMPRIVIIMDQLITMVIDQIEKHGPRLIKVGFMLIMQLLKGIRDKIDDVVEVVAETIQKFLDAFSAEVPATAKSIADTIITIMTSAAYEAGRVSGTLLVGIGKAYMQGMFDGLGLNLTPIIDFFKNLGGNILNWIGDTLSTLWQKGVDIVTGFWGGILSAIGQVIQFYRNLPGEIPGWIGDVLGTLAEKGGNLITGFWNGAKFVWQAVIDWIKDIDNKIASVFPLMGDLLVGIGKDLFEGFYNGMKWVWDHTIGPWLSGLGDLIPGPIKAALNVRSPSRVMHDLGNNIMQGLRNGMEQTWDDTEVGLQAVNPDEVIKQNLTNNVSKALNKIAIKMGDMKEFSPTITPVLDLTQVQKDASKINGYISPNNLSLSLSYSHAQAILKDTNEKAAQVPQVPDQKGHGEVNFEQNIYAPKQLSTSDIYKNTRNQIRLAKEELSIP